MAVIFVLFVRRFRNLAWRPFRGLLFSFMASSAFYPIIYACFLNGYRQMDIEAGANRYVVTVLLYLTAVTIYGVSKESVEVPGDANGRTDSRARGVEAGPVRSVGPFAPGFPFADGHWADSAFLRFCQSL